MRACQAGFDRDQLISHFQQYGADDESLYTMITNEQNTPEVEGRTNTTHEEHDQLSNLQLLSDSCRHVSFQANYQDKINKEMFPAASQKSSFKQSELEANLLRNCHRDLYLSQISQLLLLLYDNCTKLTIRLLRACPQLPTNKSYELKPGSQIMHDYNAAISLG